MNRERNVNKLGQSIAIIASVVLHVLVLLSIAGSMLPGRAPEPGVMTVYFAMSVPIPVKTPDIKANMREETAAQPVQAPTKSEALPGPSDVKSQPAPEPVILETKPEMKLTIQPAADDAMEAVFEDGKPDPSELKTKEAHEAVYSENKGITVHDAESLTPDPQAMAVNSQFSMLNSQSAHTLLAFAGDPASLGMFTSDAPGHGLVEAVILSLPEPSYPVLSRKRGEEGRVILEVTISAQGAVRRAQVNRSSSYDRLDKAALKAIRKATFAPATYDGTPVESVTKVAYRFELEGK